MTEAEFGAHRRLEMLQDFLARQAGSYGRGVRDIEHLPLAPRLLADVEICLRSNDGAAIGGGLYFLQGLLIRHETHELPPAFLQFLVARIEELLDHAPPALACKALCWFAQLRGFYPRYRERMLRSLESADAEVRKVALRYYETYAHPREIEPLLRFGTDDAARQLRAGGEWRYMLRDRAFERIEEQLEIRLPRVTVSSPYGGSVVSWYDWSPMREAWAVVARELAQQACVVARSAAAAVEGA